MNERTKAAVIGGAVAGILCVIPFVRGCCFLWAIGGGFLAVYMYMKDSPAPMEMADAAKLGAVAGVVGAVISLIIGIPMWLLGVGVAAASDQLRDSGMGGMLGAGALAGLGVVSIFIKAVFIVGLAVLGAIIGNAVLGKNRPGGGMNTPPPPPPSGFGGGDYQPPAGGAGGGSYGSPS